mmetsp:Transcript_33099/g.83756  ORF Transcript_33099/g.83756 Transcript_33099/m.83756 type:complete len:263 (-) Transcript_33099:720-1508(-)
MFSGPTNKATSLKQFKKPGWQRSELCCQLGPLRNQACCSSHHRPQAGTRWLPSKPRSHDLPLCGGTPCQHGVSDGSSPFRMHPGACRRIGVRRCAPCVAKICKVQELRRTAKSRGLMPVPLQASAWPPFLAPFSPASESSSLLVDRDGKTCIRSHSRSQICAQKRKVCTCAAHVMLNPSLAVRPGLRLAPSRLPRAYWPKTCLQTRAAAAETTAVARGASEASPATCQRPHLELLACWMAALAMANPEEGRTMAKCQHRCSH